MSVNQFNQVSYGFTQSLIAEFPLPIIAVRAPGAGDKAQLGTEWINKTTNMVYVLTSIVGNVATWVTAGGAGGAGVFASLEATNGNITADLGNIVATVGNITTTAGDINSGNDITAANNITATAGDITATAGNIVATVGDVNSGNDVNAGHDLTATNAITATNGDITATNGNIVTTVGAMLSTGDIISTNGSVQSALGNLVAVVGSLSIGGGILVTSGAGDPNGVVNAPQGSLYLNTAGNAVNNRAWINTDGVTAWTFITTGA